MEHRIKTRIVAVLVTAISFFCLSIPASAAWIGIGAGDVNGARFTYNNTPYGYFTGSDQFAWRINMYVSANEDGKIKESDTVGSTALPLVGSLLCTGDKWVTSTVVDTYIQTNYTDTSRLNLIGGYSTVSDSEGNITTKYILPIMHAVTVVVYQNYSC